MLMQDEDNLLNYVLNSDEKCKQIQTTHQE